MNERAKRDEYQHVSTMYDVLQREGCNTEEARLEPDSKTAFNG